MSALTQLNLYRAPPAARPLRARFEPAARNAFRVLGLPATASEREVFDAASSVRLALKLGVRKTFEGDAAWLEPLARGESDVRDALGRLSEPAQRAFERLFWFHGRASHAQAVNVAGLRASAEAVLSGGSASALHDAALLMLVGLLRLDHALRDADAWAHCFALWRQLAEGEEFWSQLVAADLKGGYEQLVTFAEVGRLRRRAPRLVSAPVASRASDAAARGDGAAAKRAFSLLRAAALPATLYAEYEQETLGPLEDRLEDVCKNIFSPAQRAAGLAPDKRAAGDFNAAWERFERQAKPRLRDLVEMGGTESFYVRRSLERAAEGLKDLAARYRSVGLLGQSATLLAEARRLAPAGSDVLSRIDLLLASESPAGGLSSAAYAEGLALELAEVRLPPQLGKEYLTPEEAATPDAGCGGTAVFWLIMVFCCFAVQKCGTVKTRRTSNQPDFYKMNFNYNYNYNANLNIVVPNIPPPDTRPPSEARGNRRGRGGARTRPSPSDSTATNFNLAPPPTTTDVPARNLNARPSNRNSTP